jgi:hypothetical protein
MFKSASRHKYASLGDEEDSKDVVLRTPKHGSGWPIKIEHLIGLFIFSLGLAIGTALGRHGRENHKSSVPCELPHVAEKTPLELPLLWLVNSFIIGSLTLI